MSDIIAIYIISSNGSLIFDYHSQPSNLNTDKNIVLASLFYACYANSEQIGLSLPNHDPNTPHSTGIKTLEANNFRLDCHETLTKVKFVVISDLSLGVSPATANKQELLKKIYELYADYVMKNPFYTLNMPINSDNCSLFKTNLELSLSGNYYRPGQTSIHQ
jgi:hypothetical protein